MASQEGELIELSAHRSLGLPRTIEDYLRHADINGELWAAVSDYLVSIEDIMGQELTEAEQRKYLLKYIGMILPEILEQYLY